jgi:glycosyltransferase involved in cell wall biosynthesis
MNNNPAISIILPVLNEAGTINEAIAHLRELERADLAEIIIVDGDPGGSTIKAIRDDGMNHGAALASGDILLFLHADTELPRTAIALITDELKDGRVVAGAFDLGMKSDKRIYRITETYVHLRTRLTRAPFGDQAIFMRRPYFERINRYRDIPVMEDLEIMKRIKNRGDHPVHAQELDASKLVRPRRIAGAAGEVLPVIVNAKRFSAVTLDTSNGRDILYTIGKFRVPDNKA